MLFLALFSGGPWGGNGLLGARALFGSIFGLGGADARLAAVVGAAIAIAVLALAQAAAVRQRRPPGGGRPRRPRAGAGAAFLALLGATAAEATQAVGALLLLGLLAAPAGAAQRITANPYLGLGLSALLALLAMWVGLALSYWIPNLPPSTRDHRRRGRELPARAGRRPAPAGTAPEDTDNDGRRGRWSPLGRRGKLDWDSMAKVHEKSWAAGAQEVLAQNGHHSGRRGGRCSSCSTPSPARCRRSRSRTRLRAGRRPVARASIYRILDELERLHLVQHVQVGHDMARYEPVRGGDGHHHHLVCDSCGAVTPFTDEGLEAAIRKLSRRLPMRVDDHEIVLRGRLRDVQPGVSPGPR